MIINKPNEDLLYQWDDLVLNLTMNVIALANPTIEEATQSTFICKDTSIHSYHIHLM